MFEAHCPAAEVKEYVVVVVLLMPGLQNPVIPLFEVVGRAGIAAPEQYGPTGEKLGVTFELTVIVNVVVEAHCPGVGVNEKVNEPVDEVLIAEGDQVPVIPLRDVELSAGAIEF